MRRLVFALALLVGAGIVAGFVFTKPQQPPTFLTAPVERGALTTVVEATGTVQAKLTVDVSSQLSGQVTEVFVDFNDLVKVGQPLAQLDQEIFAAREREARAAVRMAAATVDVQKAAVDRARLSVVNAGTGQSLAEALAAVAQAKQGEAERELDRKTRLAQTGNVAERDLSQTRTLRDTGAADLRAALVQVQMKSEAIDMAKADLRLAEGNLENAEGVVEQKKAALSQATLDLKRTTIRSPIDGIVLDRNVDPGQTIAVSLEAKTLFTIANDLSSMEVHGRIDEADVGKLKAGQTVRFVVDAYPDRSFNGTVLGIRQAAKVFQNVVTYTAIVSAPNPDHLLLPNMTAQLRILISDTGDTLKIPNQALRFRPNDVAGSSELPVQEPIETSGTRATVWVVGRDGRPAPIPVQIGQSDDNDTQLLKGSIAEGQLMIVGIASSQPRRGFLGIPLWF